MRTLDEQVNDVKLRVKQAEKQKKLRHSRIVGISSAAACLLFIVGIGFAMPGLLSRLPAHEYGEVGAAASIFYESGALGYVFIGLLAFALGVSVTVLCYFLRRRNNEDKKEDSDDRAD